MKEYKTKYNNVFWFLIDGLRPDFIHIEKGEKQNYIDRLLLSGTLFNNVVTAGAGTHTSMHSIFTSLLPSYNGATGWEKRALRKFRQEIFTIADYFQLAGYETFRYCDTIEERAVPMSGFKRWEASGYNTGRVLNNTDLTRTERRTRFVEDVNICKEKKFVYHHIDLLHELNGELGGYWSKENYNKNITITAIEFEKLYNEYNISDEDLVVISSDHGVELDVDYIKDGIENGDRHYEESVRSFFALISKDITPQILKKPISALDEAPTLLHVALGDETSINGQGIDRYDYMYRGTYQESIFYREKGTFCALPECQNSLTSDLFYVRDGMWKYVYSEKDPRCEWLINLEENGDYCVNLKEKYPELALKYCRMLKEKFNVSKNFQYESNLNFNKDAVQKFFSLILQTEYVEKETIESLLDMSGPYYEIFVPDSEKMRVYRNQYKLKTYDAFEFKQLPSKCKGEWIVYLKDNGEYSEYFLSDLYRYLQYHRNKNVRIIGDHYIAIRNGEIQDNRTVILYEREAVRDMEFVHEKSISKKYIIFGCGKIGKKALEYFGKEAVYCFADNNSKMAGHEVCEMRVISFEMLKQIYSNYCVVIAANATNIKEIEAQLKENDMVEYLIFKEYTRRQSDNCWESGYMVVTP